MAERPLPLFAYDPEMLRRLYTLFQEIWAARQDSIESKHSVEEIKELKNKVAACILRETEFGDFDLQRIRKRALARL